MKTETEIESILADIHSEIPSGVRLIAVSKTHSVEKIMRAYNVGERDFGENKVQELVAKAAEAPQDIRWHQIGHLQTNKVKYIAPFVYMIHSVDSDKLLSTINKEAAKACRTIKCLLQVHVAQEETKFGFTEDELLDYLRSGAYRQYENVSICGVMGMASNTDDEAQIHGEFAKIHGIYEKAKVLLTEDTEFKEVCMGMSGDYPIAVAEGATMIRVGSKIFGERDYSIQH